jgi:paraquat-inducible protein A
MLACPECDLLHQVSGAPAGTVQVCARCGAELGHGGPADLDKELALTVTALVLFVLAQAFPLLSLDLHGTAREASIAGCVRILSALGWPWLSAILLTTVVLGPLIYLAGMAVVLAQAARRRPRPWTARLFRVLEEFRRWDMVEVFVLGILVSYAKLARMAAVHPGLALFALGGFVLAEDLALSRLDSRAVWEAVGPGGGPDPGRASGVAGGPPGARAGISARQADLQACLTCGLVLDLAHPGPCPRCHAVLHSRRPDSAGRAWALLATSAILYLPANLLPVTQVLSLGRPHEDTILGGVDYFLRTGSWPLAVVIFVASVLVPLGKFVVLSFLLLSVRFRSRWRPRLRTGLYRLTENVGKWSMVDIFAITLMVAMLPAGGLASVVPRPGAMAFALMVAATILAVRCYDPRLVWDALESPHE